MGFFEDLGIGDLVSGIRDMSNEITGLKDEIISSVVGPTDDLQNTIQDIASSVTGSDDTSASAATDLTDSAN